MLYLGIFFALVTAFCLWWWARALVRLISRRKVLATPPMTIAEAIRNPGYPRKIKARITPEGQLLTAPLTRRMCVFYRVKVDHGFAGTTEHGFAHQGIDFVVSDGTGEALVLIEGVKSEALFDELALDHILSDGEERAVAERCTELGIAREVPSTGGYRRMDVFESVLVPGEEIEIIGAVTVEPLDDAARVSPDQGYRDTALRLLVTRCELRGLRDIGQPRRALLAGDDAA